MNRKKPCVFVTRMLPDIVLRRMKELFEIEVNETDEPLSIDELKIAFNKFEVVVPTVTDKINSEVINSSSQKLKLIANFGNGVDHIDIDCANKKGIFVFCEVILLRLCTFVQLFCSLNGQFLRNFDSNDRGCG